MDALQPLLDLIKATVRAALETELPAQLERHTLPNDPDKLYSYAEAAAYLGVTESAVRERIRAGDLWTVDLGKFRKIPQRAISEYIEQARLKHALSRTAPVLTEGIDPEIEALLNAESSSRHGSGGRKGQGARQRRA
jgi:excisionase family DNA binding protein